MLDIVVILDRSGSMQSGRTDHEGGLNSFVEDQKKLPGDVRFTLTQFDDQDPCHIVYDRVPIADVGPIELVPRGGTPLYAGIGQALAHVAAMQKKAAADQTIVMVITDGEDTGSNGEWTQALVKARTKELKSKDWSFLYLGANVDAFSEAANVGVAASASANYSPVTTGSVQAMYSTMSNKMGAVRTLRSRGVSASGSASALHFYEQDVQSMTAGTFVPTGPNAIKKELDNLNVANDGHTVTVTSTTGETD